MATQQTRALGKLAVAPSVIALFMWMIIPLAMTIYFSFLRYNLLDPNAACAILSPGSLTDPANRCLAGFSNYTYFITDPAFFHTRAETVGMTRKGAIIIRRTTLWP